MQYYLVPPVFEPPLYSVFFTEDKKTIRVFLSVGRARRYLFPVSHWNEFGIARVYVDKFVGNPRKFLLTYLDRPSCRTTREAFETKKLEVVFDLRQDPPESSIDILTDRGHKTRELNRICQIARNHRNDPPPPSSAGMIGLRSQVPAELRTFGSPISLTRNRSTRNT